MDIQQIVKEANAAKRSIACCTTEEKNQLLKQIAIQLQENKDELLCANARDIQHATECGIRKSIIDRLCLTEERIDTMIEGILQVIDLPDPCTEKLEEKVLKSGILCTKKRVPFGVLLMIYESRPNVTIDATVLGLKSGNALILRGGKEALQTNIKLVHFVHSALIKMGLPKEIVQLVEDTDRDLVKRLVQMRSMIDLVIPRGGASLIHFIVENSTVPVIETGSGVCHIYIDKDADLNKAISIVINAKVQRPSVCNAVETVLVDKNLPKDFVHRLIKELLDRGVEIRADKIVQDMIPDVKAASEMDWSTEYNDFILSIRMVDDIADALKHIERYGTRHSECIISENNNAVNEFFKEVDAAAVYANASTRFTDGFEFGLGAEIGISTQKMHVRGPMGLEALVTYKYVLVGHGEVRN